MADRFLSTRQQIAMKIEVTEGVDAVPVAGDQIEPVFDLEWEPVFELYDREVVATSFSKIGKTLGVRSAIVRFATEIKGKAPVTTPPPQLSVPLRCAGFGEAIFAEVAYAPISEGIPSATILIQEANQVTSKLKQKKVLGARGNVVFELNKGQPGLARFEFMGNYVTPVDAATTPWAPTGDMMVKPPAWIGATFDRGATSLPITSLTVDMGNQVTMINDVREDTGELAALITDRNPTGSFDPEQQETAVEDFFADLEAETEAQISSVWGGAIGTGLHIILSMTAQYTNIGEGDRDGIRTEEIEFGLVRSSAGGDNEISLVFN